MPTDLDHARRINDAVLDDLSRAATASQLAGRLAADPTLGISILGALRHARRELVDFALHVELERSRLALSVVEVDSQSTTLTDLPEPAATRRRIRQRNSTARIDVPLMPAMVREAPDAWVSADHTIEHRPDLGSRDRLPAPAWEVAARSPRHAMPIAFAVFAAIVAIAAAIWYLAGPATDGRRSPAPAMMEVSP